MNRPPAVYQRIPPSPALRDAVESLWVQEASAAALHGAPAWVMPTGTVELLFHYGERLVHRHGTEHVPMPRCYITGQRTRPVLPVATGRVGIVIASLHPWGAETLFPGTGAIVDGFTDLADIFPAAELCALQDRLFAAPSSADRIREVECFLLEQRAEPGTDPRVVAATRLLAAGRVPATRSVAQELGISPRHLARLFRSTVGLPPKTFSRIMRFQSVLRLRRERGWDWADIAAECGYSDQPHLIREMREFSFRTPTDLPQASGALDRAFNGQGASGYFDTVYL